MAEGYDFFDNTATGGSGRSSPLRDESSTPIFHGGKEEFRSRGLELTLGPSNFMDTSASPPPHQRHSVGDTLAFPFLQEQSSGNLASFLLSAPYTTQKSFLQSEGSKVSRLQDVSYGLLKQKSGNFVNVGDLAQSSLMNPPDSAHPSTKVIRSSGLPSIDQVWQEVQKGRTTLASSSNDSSSMWNRRAMSLHTTSPLIVEKDMERRQMRRSLSNGVPPHACERPSSGIELFFDCALQQRGTSSQSPLFAEVEDLQKRKEEQAERRFQARKRRRILVGDKQHKKGRQIGSSLDGKSQRKGPDNRVYHGEGFTAGDEDVALDSGCIFPDEPISGRDGMCRDSDGDIQASSNEDIQRPWLEGQSGAAVRCASVHKHGNGGETASFLTNQLASGIDGSIPSSDLENAGPTRRLYAMSCLPIANKENEGWKLHPAKDHGRIQGLDGEGTGAFLSSEDGCQEINGSVSDAAKEEVGIARPRHSSVSSAPGVPSSSRLPCMQSAFAAVGAASAVDFTKTNAPLPYIAQDPAVGSHGNEFSLQPSTIVHGLFTNVINGSGMIPALSGAFLSRTISAMGSSEGKKEGSAFLPLSKAFSNTKGYFDEPQNAGARLDFQASLSASQLSSTSTVVSDTSVGKNVLLERQHQPLGRRLSSQSSCVVDQALSCSRPGQSGVPMSFVPSSLRLGYSDSKQEERAKPEEMSSESQLASEHSVDASHSQSADKETERSRALVDLLWVTTTGNGPQGKTINGFMYIAGGRHVRLVCCCHGKHMSPAEFVQHSGSNDLSNPERNIVVSPLPPFNHKGASTPV